MLFEISEKAEKEISKYCDDYEIFISQSKNYELDSKKTELNFAKEEINLGLGIRIIKDNKLGFAFTSDPNKIESTVKQAISNSKLNETDENLSFSEVNKIKEVKGLSDQKFNDLTIEEYIAFLKDIIEIADDKCEVTSAGFSAMKEKSLILNSNGVSVSDEGTAFGVGLSVNAVKDGELSTSYDSLYSRTYDLNGEKLAEDVCNLAINSLGGKNIETENTEVILDYDACRGLLSSFISGFSAENVQRGRSRLQDKIGEQIVSENLSIIDDGTIPGGLGSGSTDSEGTPSQKTTLVENGVLKSFIYDIYTGNKGNCESTSNGFRGYSNIPSVSPSNVLFDFKKSMKLDEIDKGIFVTNVLGAHTANPISGDFSVEASNAFMIENGELSTPVKKAMISGNIFDLLSNCEKIDSEIKQKGSFIIPRMLMHDLRVIG